MIGSNRTRKLGHWTRRINDLIPTRHMITPEDIRSKAKRLYRAAIRAWLAGDESFFPRRLKVALEQPRDFSSARAAHQLLLESSKERVGKGYSLLRRKKNKRLLCEQHFINAVYFDTLDDLLHVIGKTRDFRTLRRCVALIERDLPALRGWCNRNWSILMKVAPVLEELIQFAAYVRANPRPGCHVRELPIAISTKTVERYEGVLTQWLRILLPTHFIDERATTFAERFGFIESKNHFRFRLLDSCLFAELTCPGHELSLPIDLLAALPVQNSCVVIVENKVNLAKLPAMQRTLALGGLGYGITQLFAIPWLATSGLYYWGDIDVEGLAILALLRRRFPHARSLFMDAHTVTRHESLKVRRETVAPERPCPAELDDEERQVYARCREESLRIEQERISSEYVRTRMLELQLPLATGFPGASP